MEDEPHTSIEREDPLNRPRPIVGKLTLALLIVAMVSAFAGPAYAPKYLGLPPLVSGDCVMPSGEEGTADGSFEVGRFDGSHGELTVTGMLQAGCITDSDVTGFEPMPVTMVADVYEATCDSFRFHLVGGTTIKDAEFDYTGSSIDLFYVSGDPRSLHGQLCVIARWHDQGVLAERSTALTRMLVDDPMTAQPAGDR